MPDSIPLNMQPWFASLPVWPLLAAALIGVLIAARRATRIAPVLAIGGVGMAAVLAVMLLVNSARHVPGAAAEQARGDAELRLHIRDHFRWPVLTSAPEERRPPIATYTLYRWISFGSTERNANRWIEVNFSIDGLTAVMLVVVCVVSLMVVIYAAGYMKDHHGHPEPGYARFFAFLALFVFSMCVLVLAGNFVLLYLGWEAVGLCSYLLIGFYFRRPAAAAAAKKAFLVNRIGDLGFAVGIFALYQYVRPHCLAGENPLDYAVAFKYALSGALTQGQLTTVALLLLCGALGKSAQFPLYVWLPDAMEGPTPVSALIHAATMVTAGVYLIARCGPIFAGAAPWVYDVILTLGMIGAIMAATMAMAQFDMKRILAYSTISQLAFMFVALGCRAPLSAIFHLYTHAFFKALLFLTAGSVMHAMGGAIDLRQFSGLRKVLPTTYKQMLVGCLALSGFPLLAGFWSKDEIVHAAFVRSPLVGLLLLLTAGLTAYYTFRMFFLCFHGPLRLPRQAGEHPHDMPRVMTWPLWFLAAGAVLSGFAGVTLTWPSLTTAFLLVLQPHGAIHRLLHESTIVAPVAHAGNAGVAYLSMVVALAGIWLAWRRFGEAPQSDPDQAALGRVWQLWHRKYFVDEIYDAVFVRPLRGVGRVCFGIDEHGIDNLIAFVAAVPRSVGRVLGLVQSGQLQTYALSMTLGVVALVLLWIWL